MKVLGFQTLKDMSLASNDTYGVRHVTGCWLKVMRRSASEARDVCGSWRGWRCEAGRWVDMWHGSARISLLRKGILGYDVGHVKGVVC